MFVRLNVHAPLLKRDANKPLVYFYAKRHNIMFNKQMSRIIHELFPKTKVGGFLIYHEGDALVMYLKFVNEEQAAKLPNVFTISPLTTSPQGKQYNSGWLQSFINNYYNVNGFYIIDRFSVSPELIVKDKTAFFKVDLTNNRKNINFYKKT
jgi:hypothetical protein